MPFYYFTREVRREKAKEGQEEVDVRLFQQRTIRFLPKSMQVVVMASNTHDLIFRLGKI